MSNIESNNFDVSFDTYGKALDKVLKDRGLSKKWLAKKIKMEPAKLSSVQSQISRWLKGRPVGDGYQERINRSLDITIKQKSKGEWVIQEGYRSQKVLADVGHSKETIAEYREKARTLDDLPEILRLKNELEGWIDELLKKRHD